MKDKIKVITDGAIIAAIYAIVFIISRFVGGLLEEWIYFILPIPITIYGYKYSLKDSLIVVIATVSLSFILLNPLSALFYVLPTVSLGMFYPLIIKKDKNTMVEILFTTVISLLTNVLSMVIFGYLFNYDIIEDSMSFINVILNFFINLGIDESVINFIKMFFVSLIPSVIILTSLMEGIIVTMITNILLTRLKLRQKALFKQMLTIETIPTIVGIMYIVLFVLAIGSIICLTIENTMIFVIASTIINILVIYTFFMMYQGFYVIGKYARKTNKMWLYFLAILSLFIAPIIPVIVGLCQNLSHFSLKI